MLTRRRFLTKSIVVVSTGIALPPLFAMAVHAAVNNPSLAPEFKNRVLVIVQMAGGNDGLNTVIPFGDGRYHDVRPGIQIGEGMVLPIADGVGLHPSMGRMKELWDQGSLAVVQGTGYPNPNLSHFRSMEIWQTGSPEETARTGWVGRYFQRVLDEEGHLLDGLSVGNTAPLVMRAPDADVAAVPSLQGYKVQGDPSFPGDADPRVEALLNLYASYPSSAPYAAVLSSAADLAYRSTQELERAAGAYQPAVEYPQTPLGNGFGMLARVIGQDLGIKVLHIGIGGFDTHANQPNTQARLLGILSDALAAFYRDLEAHGKAQEVLIMTWSEFGRRVQENANNGTDHGTAAPLFLLGGGVQGGLYGEAPSLRQLQDGNLRFTTDFRSVYATVLDRWLGVAHEDVLGKSYEKLRLLS